jgi:hypothetical protein
LDWFGRPAAAWRTSGGQNTRLSMADIGTAAFSVFFMQSPSFLAH